MSNTIRRKNAWNKNTRVSESLTDIEEMLGFKAHESKWYRSKDFNRYKNWTKKEVIKKTENLFHSDSWFDDELIEQSYKKRWNRYLRRVDKQHIIEALKTGEEENLFHVSRKEAEWGWDYWFYW